MAHPNSNWISRSVWGNWAGWQATADAIRKIGFSFETEYNRRALQDWFKENWTFTCYCSAAYLVIIFGLQNFMRERAKFELRRYLAIWNFLLSLFSILSTLRMLPDMLYLLSQKEGFHQSVCVPNAESSPVFCFWSHLYVLSKVPELVDTLFIVLRKQQLIFLHWYHHITVMIYTWYSTTHDISSSRWFLLMNCAVHSIMYSYFGLRALRVPVPKSVAATITSLQILQMVVGVAVNVYALIAKSAGIECDVPLENIYWSLALYGSYFLLFLDFFWKAYVSKERKTDAMRGSIKKD